MFKFQGNTSTQATSDQMNLPTVINNYSVANKSAVNVYFNVYLITGVGELNINPMDSGLSPNQMYSDERNIVVLATEQIRVQTTGSVDYMFNMQNIEVPNQNSSVVVVNAK